MTALPRARRPSAEQVEPVVPVVLGCHGTAIVAFAEGPGWTIAPFLAVVALGLAGLLGWSSVSARWTRAVLLTGVALVLSLAEPTLVPSLLQWYYCVVAVYPLMLWGRGVWAIGPLSGLCYVGQVVAGSTPVPLGVAVLRAGVLTALGLVTWTTGVAYRALTREAEDGRWAAERAGRSLEHAATHDALTGLANRTRLLQVLDEALGRGGSVAVLLLDLDQFKEVNDTLGHRYGDALLAQVGSRLVSLVGPGDTVARLGGDEFVVVLDGGDEDRARLLGAVVREALQDPFVVEEALIAVDVSTGLVVSGRTGDTAERLLQHADVAMYAAKSDGRGLALYDHAMDRQGATSLALLAELRGAIGRGELVVEYQPKIRTDDRRVAGLEALVRWDHPVRGRIGPDVFIPLAERSGVIAPLTVFVLDHALAQCRLWREAGLALDVSVNLSARSLTQDDLPEQVADALAAHGLPPGALELEITESFLMADLVRARCVLQRLHDSGVRLAVDDFGTGLSSLAYLKNLPVHVLKVDKSFVTGMLDDVVDTRIVRGIVDLATSLGLETVAEGVEDAATLHHLQVVGCTHAQGWVISRPLPADRVVAWCRDWDPPELTTPLLRSAVPEARGA